MVQASRTRFGGIFRLAWLFAAVFTPGSGQAHEPSDLQAYGRQLQTAIVSRWNWPLHLPQESSCKVLIKQLPGGEVVDIVLLPECSFDDIGRSAIREAIARAAPLPYEGFESVFRPEVVLNFRIPTRPPTRLELVEMQEKSAEASPYKVLSEQNRPRFGAYLDGCIKHIQASLLVSPGLPQRPSTRMMTISLRSDGSLGHVVAEGTRAYDRESADLVSIVQSVAPCEPFPPEMKEDTRSLLFTHDFMMRK